MKNLLVQVSPLKCLIQPTGWAQKNLAHKKIDLTGLCGYGCGYCSSSTNRYHAVYGAEHRRLTVLQLGHEATPTTHPELTYTFPDPVGQLRAELATKPKAYGNGQTLAFGCLTDNFAPKVLTSGVTRQCLDLLLECTSFRIRILTKNSVIGNSEWVSYFAQHADRFVVGLSIGTLDDLWARRIEINTPAPTARVRALHALQDAGVPTFGMLCPVFPNALANLDKLVDAIRPERCEYVWAEPYNDRVNWTTVNGDAETFADLTRMFGPQKDKNAWSDYAVRLYKRLRLHAERDGWLPKLAYMLYEASLLADYARSFTDLRGVLLQSVDKTGRSKHPVFAELQDRLQITRYDRISADAGDDE